MDVAWLLSGSLIHNVRSQRLPLFGALPPSG
jgi:hypothetical protein